MVRRVHLALLRLYRRLPRRARRFAVHRLAPCYSVGAICIVERDDGALLLVRHSYRKRWGFPGGLLQRGEEATIAARREAMEEVGLRIETIAPPAVVVDPRARRVDVIYRCLPAAGEALDELRPRSPEIVEVGWFDPQQLPELQKEAASAVIEVARGTRPRDAAD